MDTFKDLILATNKDLHEHRPVRRLPAYGRDLAPQGRPPAAHGIQPADLADPWPAHVGDVHVANHGRDLAGRPAEEAGGDTPLGCAVACLDEVLSLEIPIAYGGTFTGADGEPVADGGILPPLSDPGDALIGVLGGASRRLEAFK